MDVDKNYGQFLKRRRKEKQIKQSVLEKGLFSPSGLGKVERGERYPDKLTRDRLLARLGESGYDYECFLQPEEYKDWEERRDILDSLDNLELEKAEQLIDQYGKKKTTKEKVVRQYFLAMQVQWMELKGVSLEERCGVLEETVELTVPKFDTTSLSQWVLSIQELNLILEYQAHKYPEKLQDFCLELLQYLEHNFFDLESKAMLGAKTALYYCNAMEQKVEQEAEPKVILQSLEQAFKICTDGIEALRNHQKIYFAWELLQKRAQYIKRILKYNVMFTESCLEKYQKELEQTMEFYRLLDSLYEKYQVPKETNGFTCFYREHEIYCINDVVRTRRRMLGISRSELERELLGKSTLKRLEKNETNLQMENARRLFEKLNLSVEMHRAQIVTDSWEAVQVEKEFRWELEQRNFEKAERLLIKLKDLIPISNRINQQYVFYSENCLGYEKGELSKEKFIRYAKEALELTIPISIAMAEIKEERLYNGKVWQGEKYLTNMEVTIIYNIARKGDNDKKNEYWDALKEYFDWLEKKCTLAPVFGMYGFVMTVVASRIGNMDQYETSSAINKKILREALRLRTFSYVRRNMYALLWNEYKQKGLPMNKEDPEWRKGLLDCLNVDIYCKDEWQASKMLERMDK